MEAPQQTMADDVIVMGFYWFRRGKIRRRAAARVCSVVAENEWWCGQR
jgi:hypothetical protein